MSIGEVLSLYRDRDIEIHPEFQRIFRWKPEQKSKLIESILLGIPIPPIFVSQRTDGVWDVIDGVQRLSTILEFMGEYRDENDEVRPQSELLAGEYLSELEGYAWSDDQGGSRKIFNETLRRDFKRAKLDFRIITKESDKNAKYDLFQRLNAGSFLSPQEARNCLLVMLDREMFLQLTLLSQRDDFAACVSLSDRQEEQAYRDELVLRFFCQMDYRGDSKELPIEFGEYLTGWMRGVAERQAQPKLNPEPFEQTFALLRSALGEDSFRRFDGNRHTGPFSISAYEFITSGLVANLDHWLGQPTETLASRVRDVWTNREFSSNSGTGISSRRRMPKLINASRVHFAG